MIVITDSGSTKADWIFTSRDGQELSLQTMGLNPFLHSADQIEEVLNRDLVPVADVTGVNAVYYYGAGCSDEKRVHIMTDGLRRVFTRATIHVEHDLLAAARATCGNSPGIACILGTGSNSCLYDGGDILDNVASLGYIVGDEGSGSHLGKYLIRAFFYRELPDELMAAFRKEIAPDKSMVLDQIYGPAPNVYLASLATFIHEHLGSTYLQELAKSSFREFISRHVLKYEGHERLPIHFIGSIAFYFKDLLLEVLSEFHLQKGVIIPKPIAPLVSYHRQHSFS
ncbi:MAG: hypothetical protein K9I85_00825 [Saprospiraceae bacterium]|nr:hypothetical protein [Saprospiraceae bacterium]